MMTTLLRMLVLVGLALFWGGLTFYTGFVVRIIHDVLNDPIDGGLITQRVTAVLQLLGFIVAVLMIGNSVSVFRQSKRHGVSLALCAVLFSCSLAGLHFAHARLDEVIDVQNREVTDRDAFIAGHRRYNQLTTIQWISSTAYLAMTVFAWRSVDCQPTRRG